MIARCEPSPAMIPPDTVRAGMADLAQCGTVQRLRPGHPAGGSRIGSCHRPNDAAATLDRPRYTVARCWQPTILIRSVASLPLQSP